MDYYRTILVYFTLVVTLVVGIESVLSGSLPKQNRRRESGVNLDPVADETDQRILDFFGFKKKPAPGRDVHIPRLMQHLYKSHMGDYFVGPEQMEKVWEVGFDLPPDHVTGRVNTARSFHHIDQDEILSGMPDHLVHLRFNVSSLPQEEVIGSSELLLHREAIQSHVMSGEGRLHRINVYQIVKIAEPIALELNRNNFDSSGTISRLLDTRLVDTRNSTWERFDVSVAAQAWAHQQHEENFGLLIEVVGDNDKEDSISEEDRKHVRLKRDLHRDLSDAEWQDRRPTLVTYTHDGKKTNLRRRSRAKRNSRRKDSNSSRRKRKRKRRHRPCARYNLYVDFSEVGWHEWIVAPHGYDAFYCQGQCLFPLAEHLNATNHAIVQTLTNSVHPSVVPSPCCVPTELSSISMLYVDEHNLVVLKSYPKMSVEACGCR